MSRRALLLLGVAGFLLACAAAADRDEKGGLTFDLREISARRFGGGGVARLPAAGASRCRVFAFR